jgi:hypothetical protein
MRQQERRRRLSNRQPLQATAVDGYREKANATSNPTRRHGRACSNLHLGTTAATALRHPTTQQLGGRYPRLFLDARRLDLARASTSRCGTARGPPPRSQAPASTSSRRASSSPDAAAPPPLQPGAAAEEKARRVAERSASRAVRGRSTMVTRQVDGGGGSVEGRGRVGERLT